MTVRRCYATRSAPKGRWSPHLFALSVFLGACAADLPTGPSGLDAGPRLAKGGKPGVQPGPVEQTPLAVTFADGTDDAIRSDGLHGGAYEDGSCGVEAHFNSTSDDAILRPHASRIRRRDEAACGTSERVIQLDLGFTQVEGGFMNIDKVRTVETSQARRAQFNVEGCNRLVFDPTEFDSTDYVVVERIDDSTWSARADVGFATAHCVDLGVDVEMPFAVVIRLAS